MDGESAKWIISQGIGCVLAAVIFYQYRRDVHSALNSWRDQTRILLDLVASSTAATQKNTDAVVSLRDALPRSCPLASTLTDAPSEREARRAVDRAMDRMEKWSDGGPGDGR